MGERQLVPSIVPPCVTRYSCLAVVISTKCRLVVSVGRRLEAHGSRASSRGTSAGLSAPTLGWATPNEAIRETATPIRFMVAPLCSEPVRAMAYREVSHPPDKRVRAAPLFPG